MDGGAVMMLYGFCALMGIVEGGSDVVKLGYVSEDKCIVQMISGDSEGQTDSINGHEIGVEMLEDGAVVHLDDLLFVITKTPDV